MNINGVQFKDLKGLKNSSSQIREIFRKDRVLNHHIKFSRYYYACTSCYSLNEGIEFRHQKLVMKCTQCGASFTKCIKSKRNPELTDFWIKNCFSSILQILKKLSILLQKDKDTLTDNDLQLVYGLRNYTTIHFGVYKNMKLSEKTRAMREPKR